jgi:FixJ family two-component response regulator
LPTVVHVVDDEPSVRKAVSRLLRAAGYAVAVYESAEQLLDHMPGVNGLTVQERLERIGSAMPIVFMTGSVEPTQGGADGLLKKPVSKEKLLDAIERALRSFRAAG